MSKTTKNSGRRKNTEVKDAVHPLLAYADLIMKGENPLYGNAKKNITMSTYRINFKQLHQRPEFLRNVGV